uniref:Uncharacterized protein n=1 Tax=Rhizobium meliloti TaxID=382 RepID=I2E1B4_RHIML|nr:short hypothetical protein [Sinorhizobium meliloti]
MLMALIAGESVCRRQGVLMDRSHIRPRSAMNGVLRCTP